MSTLLHIESSPLHPRHRVAQLEHDADLAYETWQCVKSEYPGREWDHITEPLRTKWLDADAAWHVAEYGVKA